MHKKAILNSKNLIKKRSKIITLYFVIITIFNAIFKKHGMLTRELQKYVQGGYIYIPAKEGQYKKWGELSGCRKELNKRNKSIIEKYQNGTPVEEFAGIYHLLVYAIRKIIY